MAASGTINSPGFHYRTAVWEHFIGAILLGFAPYPLWVAFFSSDYYGFFVPTGKESITLILTVAAVAITISISVLISKKTDVYGNYPELRLEKWNLGMTAVHLLAWAAYLFAYETLFRGLLFFPYAEKLGLWPAVVLNTLLYFAFHIPKGKMEMIASLPLGIVLCLLTYSTCTIWPALIMHITLSWTGVLMGISRFRVSNPEKRS